MKNNFKVYIHRNLINGKVYIGQTCKTLQSRSGVDGKNYIKSTHFWNAIKKYGWDNFEHEVLYEGLTGEEANEIERKLIKQYNSNNDKFGYNLDSGGKNGNTRSEETKEKLRNKKLGELNPNFGKKLSKETRERMSISRTGEKHPMYGKHHSKETKEKISKKKKGVKLDGKKRRSFTREQIEKLRNDNLGKKLSYESRRKISESLKGRKFSKELCNKIAVSESIPIVQLDKNGNFIKEHIGASFAARELNIYDTNIRKCCKHERKTTGGYKWMYLSEWKELNKHE